MSVLDLNDRENYEAAKARLHDAAVAAEDRLHGRSPEQGNPRIRWGSETRGHVMGPGPAGPRCVGCERPWVDALAEADCPGDARAG